MFRWANHYQKSNQAPTCAALVSDFYARQGVRLRGSTRDWLRLPSPGRLEPGDLVFLKPTQGQQACVGLYLGSGWLLTNPNGQLKVSPVRDYQNRYYAARRVVQGVRGQVQAQRVAWGNGSGRYRWPLEAFVITTRYGVPGVYQRFHTGLDMAAPLGTPIYAAYGGAVSVAGWSSQGYGLHVVLEHGNQQTLYAHMQQVAVRVGQTMQQGQVIGYVGSTGWSTGPHLHFEVRTLGGFINPLQVLP